MTSAGRLEAVGDTERAFVWEIEELDFGLGPGLLLGFGPDFARGLEGLEGDCERGRGSGKVGESGEDGEEVE